MNDSVTVLPVPTARRWSPTRAGVVNLWRYWDETFLFHHGRLLLRGPNGSGKSMALELLLPFLLDADASPARLTSAAKSRGGLYDRVMTGCTDSGRVGFAWVEFRRGPDVFTVGVRLRAATSSRKVDLDFFTTSLAVGSGLSLLDDQRAPLSRRGLVEALGESGRVHSSGEEHRAAVREALFAGFGADRYASVIGALLALRKEKVSQNLDLAKLSEVLSEALPPLDDHDLAVVAEGFERLDRRRAELAGLQAELDEVKTLAAGQRAYARVVLARLAREVRAAKTRRDDVTRAERSASEALEDAEARAESITREAEGLVSRLGDLGAEVGALKDSEAYREGGNLDDLRSRATSLKHLVVRDRKTAHEAEREHQRRLEEFEAAEQDRATAQSNVEVARVDLRGLAPLVGAEAVADEATRTDPDDGERLVRAWVGARRDQVGKVRAALTAHGRAVDQRGFAEKRVADDHAAVDERQAERREAQRSLAEVLDTYGMDVRAWATSCDTVGPDRVVGVLPVSLDDPADVRDAVNDLAGELRAENAVARRDVEAAVSASDEQRSAFVDERRILLDGEQVEPSAPDWRSDRTERRGAPLWRLVDRRPDIPEEQIDGLEAALGASSLLDAWVSADGKVDLPDGVADVMLVPTTTLGRSLADLLVPLEDAPVDAGLVHAVLSSLPIADSVTEPGHDILLGLDGTFRLGSGVGRGRLKPAELLGAEAQQRWRLARISQLDASIAETDADLAQFRRDLEAIDARETAALAELAALPSGRPVADAKGRADTADTRLADAEARREKSQGALAEAENAVRQAFRTLTSAAAQHHLPTTEEELEQIATAIADLQRAAETWARRARELSGCGRRCRRAQDDAERAGTVAADAARHAAEIEREANEVAVRLATLESTVGVEYRQVLEALAVLDEERRTHVERQQQLGVELPKLHESIGGLKSTLSAATEERQRAERERDEAHRRFGASIVDGIASDAAVEVPPRAESVTAVLEAAQAVAAALDNVAADDTALERASARVEERLHHARGSLSGRVDLDRELAEDGWWVLRASTGGLRRSAGDLADALRAELESGQAELAADEERLFEQTLAGSVRRALADRIRLAKGLVEAINKQLDAVKTAAGGVHVQLRWDVDPEQPDAVRSARSLLLRDPASLSDLERGSLQDFVRARVDQARAELEANAPWEARLRETLDYRAWHRFSLQLAHRDWEGFQPATAKRLQKLSTGERSIALHLPMLASIAAHYSDSNGEPAECPRLILLDELFAGVDTANRVQLFGTFSAWDLDAVFTSDHEWCQYATLDGIAIHHLHPAVGDEPVTSTRFTWDGRHRRIDAGEAA